MRTAVIGVGNMGSRYASLIMEGKAGALELAALTRVRDPYRERLSQAIGGGLPVYESADALFCAVEAGREAIDAVVIATPHYSHSELAVRAFRDGLHVLLDKPSGVYSRQAREMEEAALASGKVFGMIFQMRTFPIYRRLHEIVHSGQYGALKRVNYVVTDWYRPAAYYRASAWRATWRGDGGGVLLNQCPHNLDLLMWICGMPSRVRAFCHEGRFHDIEVEDDVTMYLEWPQGATGTFITSTGDAPGINRLEISLEEAMLVVENGSLRIGALGPELGCREAEYRERADDYFRKLRGSWRTETFPEAGDPYAAVLTAYADAIAGRGGNVADGSEGRYSLLISNAAYLSSFEERTVEIPQKNSPMEREFERRFESHLERKAGQRFISEASPLM